MTIKNIDDEDGFKAVKKARLECRDIKTSIDAERETLKAPFLAAGRRIDAEAKRLQAIINPEENRLKSLEDKIETELKRIEQEKIDDRFRDRKKRLEDVGGAAGGIPSNLREWTDDAFVDFLESTAEFNRAKKEREEAFAAKQKEEADKLAEDKRLLAEAKRQLDEQAEKQKQAQAKIDADAKHERLRVSAETDPMNLKGDWTLDELQERNRLFPRKAEEPGSEIHSGTTFSWPSQQISIRLPDIIAEPSDSIIRKDSKCESNHEDWVRVVEFGKSIAKIVPPSLSDGAIEEQNAINAAYKNLLTVCLNAADYFEDVEIEFEQSQACGA